MEAIVEQVLRSPKARLYANEIEAALCREQAARQRFKSDLPEGQKAEFINGEVIVHSPAKLAHLRIVLRTAKLLSTFAELNRSGLVTTEKALIALTRNDYEPDVCFWRTAKSDAFEPKQMEFPAPDLAVEVVSESTEQRDRGLKFDDYAAHGVEEYWILSPEAQTAEQYVLRADRYELAQKSSDGHLQSIALKGLAIPVRALFDEGENLAALRRIVTGS